MQNFLYKSEFYHVNKNSFSYERPCSKTHFEKKRYKTTRKWPILPVSFINDLALSSIQYVAVKFKRNSVSSQ